MIQKISSRQSSDAQTDEHMVITSNTLHPPPPLYQDPDVTEAVKLFPSSLNFQIL